VKGKQGITVAVCTRDRHDDLERCIRSVAAQSVIFPVEILIMDDGNVPTWLLNKLSIDLNNPNINLSYYKKQLKGLLRSRIETVEKAKHEIILFVDDDVELGNGYLCKLENLFSRFPGAVGFGGRDVHIGSSFIWSLFCNIFLYGARQPGKLSLSGYGGSMIKWGTMKAPFQTEYLAGCNMAFRRIALLGLRPVEWLSGYSLGEDIYLTQFASRQGQIWVDPDLIVVHHQTSCSRDQIEKVAYTEIVNHYYLLHDNMNKSSRSIYFFYLLWTAFGLLIRALLKKKYRIKATGYWRGIKFVMGFQRGRFGHESVFNHGND
jgi:glycosyltransferase involved in cell wall biosynthesis